MPLELSMLLDGLKPERAVLFFGAGSSMPSGAPTGAQLADFLASRSGLPAEGFSLSEIASLIEQQQSRRVLVAHLREKLASLKPTGGLLNLPLYNWRSIYTTNYDNLIEQCFLRAQKALKVYSSDFDFTIHDEPEAVSLFKLHGTIDKDTSDGNVSRLIVTDADYDQATQYREALYDRLRGDLAGAHLIIIGYSLNDPHIKDLISRAVEIGRESGAIKMSLLLYSRDDYRAQLLERRGFSVCFAGIDDFFSALANRLPEQPSIPSEDILDTAPALRPITIDVAHASGLTSDVVAMLNGRPATYADIVAGATFERTIAEQLDTFLLSPASLVATILGASGVGKTTAARQLMHRLRHRGHLCWEHQSDHTLSVKDWTHVASRLHDNGLLGVVFVDEAHSHLQQLNPLLDALATYDSSPLRIVCVSTRNHWYPRIKTPYFFKRGKDFKLARLQSEEIDRLIKLVDNNAEIRSLVEQTFSGFSFLERRRRLAERCQADMFVCLKNIFASEKIDDIILREYASLDSACQDVYRHVAAMENAGIHVHRQLVIRLLGIPAHTISALLVHLADIVLEYPINEREGLYGWRGRHQVIAGIIAKYKYPDIDKRAELISQVIDCISPTYEIEVRTVRELCNVESGLPAIPDKQKQNTLLRKMMSVVPGERVPRHRLIRNLIEMGEFEKAETEMRIFEKDFGRDGPVARYRVTLMVERAKRTPGILEEDRLAILEQARVLAVNSIGRHVYNKNLIAAYCEVGIEWHRRTGDYTVYDAAMKELKEAEDRLGDPDISRMIARLDNRMRGEEASEEDDARLSAV